MRARYERLLGTEQHSGQRGAYTYVSKLDRGVSNQFHVGVTYIHRGQLLRMLLSNKQPKHISLVALHVRVDTKDVNRPPETKVLVDRAGCSSKTEYRGATPYVRIV